MPLSHCPTCNALLLESEVARHRCPPEWEVWCSEDGEEREDARRIRARDEEEAAEKWAQRRDSDGDYSIVNGNYPVVCVASPDGETVQRFEIEGSMVPEYWAHELKGEKV